MKTPVKAAARWTGERFELDELPYWMAVALGNGALTFNDENIAVETSEGPVSGGPGDWLMLLEDDSLAVASDDDFRNDFEVIL